MKKIKINNERTNFFLTSMYVSISSSVELELLLQMLALVDLMSVNSRLTFPSSTLQAKVENICKSRSLKVISSADSSHSEVKPEVSDFHLKLKRSHVLALFEKT
jgi:hypothetical protein